MKLTVWFTASLLASISMAGQAQSSYGVTAGGGIGLALRGGRAGSPVFQPMVGGFFETPRGRKVATRIEVRLVRRTVRWDQSGPGLNQEEYASREDNRLRYVELPMTVKWQSRGRIAGTSFFASTGAVVGRLLDCVQVVTVQSRSFGAGSSQGKCSEVEGINVSPRFRASAWSWGLDFGIGGRLAFGRWRPELEMRYTVDVTSIQPNADPGVYGRRLLLMLSWARLR